MHNHVAFCHTNISQPCNVTNEKIIFESLVQCKDGETVHVWTCDKVQVFCAEAGWIHTDHTHM